MSYNPYRRNPLIAADSYKIGHPLFLPEGLNLMHDNVEARTGGMWPEAVAMGDQAFVEDVLLQPFTQEDIEEAVVFYNMHFPPVTANKIFSREKAEYVLKTYGGIWPVSIKAVPEGMVIPEGNVLSVIESDDPIVASCVGYLETLKLSYNWAMTTIATNSYQMKKIIKKYGEETSDDLSWLPFALHDFGARGIVPGGQLAACGAHLANFMGSDTLEAIRYMQLRYGVKEGLPGYSVLATEHSVMGSEGRDGEFKVVERALRIAIGMGKGNILSIVNDTYDMENHIRVVSSQFKQMIIDGELRWVTRPDSGYPPEVVVRNLQILEEYWGTTVNSKGYKVLPTYVRVLQGDGIDIMMLEDVLRAVKAAGYSTENVIFGSGGGLVQKVNRDTLRFAMKATYMEVNGVGRDIFKAPKTDMTKQSKKGRVSLFRKNGTGEFFTATRESLVGKEGWFTEVLVPIYKNGVQLKRYTLDEVRANTGLW